MGKLASKLRQRITIEEPVYTSDLLGGFITAWNNYAVLWAEVTPLQNSERFSVERITQVNNCRITTRYIPGITAKMRILHKSRYYNIRSVVNVGELNEKLEITASEAK